VLPYDQAGADRGNADKINKELSSYDADAKAALSSLKSHPKCTGKVGSMVFGIVW
jgi:carboxymethylenebutenolidase